MMAMYRANTLMYLLCIRVLSSRCFVSLKSLLHFYSKDLLSVFLIALIMQPKELVGFLVLLNQLICKFNTSVQDILENVYPVIAGRIFSILPRDTIPSGPGSNTEVYELAKFILF